MFILSNNITGAFFLECSDLQQRPPSVIIIITMEGGLYYVQQQLERKVVVVVRKRELWITSNKVREYLCVLIYVI